MNTASKSVVAQEWAASQGAKLSPMLKRARQLFYGVVSRDPHDIELREMPDGTCQVVCFPDEALARRLRLKALERGADGVVVVAEAASWEALLGSNPDER